MAGLNSLLTGTSTSQTTLPSWYDTAQQNVVNQAQTQTAAMPQLQNTVAGTAINNLSGVNNPFLTAQNQLQQIGAGAANPWITDTTTGQVTPNTATPLGGLFQAQNQALEQVLPSTIAPVQAGAIGSGNFGSLRGQTAVDKAKADALANLQAQQMQAALTSQQTGINAATGLSGVGAQGTSTMMQTGQAQQAAPLTATADLAKILASVNAPASVTQSDQLSPLQQMTTLLSGVNTGVTGANTLLGTLFPKAGAGGTPLNLSGLFSGLGNLFTGGNLANDIVDSGLAGSSLNQADVDALLEKYPEYTSFFASLPQFNVNESNIDTSGGDVQGGTVEFQ